MQLNKERPRTFEEHVFATLLDALAIDYHMQVLFHDYWLDHYGVSAFHVDFVIYTPACVIFEIDSSTRHGWRQRRRTRMRDEFLAAQGFRVVHIPEKDLQRSPRTVASRIWSLVIGD